MVPNNSSLLKSAPKPEAQTQTKRVLLLVPDMSSETGGVASVNFSLLKLLANLQDEKKIHLKLHALKALQNPEEDKVIKKWVGKERKFHSGSPFLFSIRTIYESLRWADIVVSTHVGLSSISSLIPKAYRPLWLTFLHGLDVWYPLSGFKRRGLFASDLLVSNSLFTANRCREFNPWLPPVLPCLLGVTHSSDTPLHLPYTNKALGLRAEPTDILIVGRMERGEGLKGHEQLFKALPLIREKIPHARLIVAGGGNNVEFYKKLAHESQAAEHIHFVGYVSTADLSTLYRSVGVFAMPSRQEGFGLVYVEAMREGLPCVVSKQDAGHEVITEGKTGLSVQFDDTLSLAEAITRIIGNPSLRREMSQNAKLSYSHRFTEEKFHQRFCEILKRAGVET